MAAPQNNQVASSGLVDNDDIEHWKNRVNDVLMRPSEHLNSASPPDAQPWHAALFDCFNPLDLCLVSWCVPCITFGKTHHRMRKDSNLAGYEPVNTSCLLYLGATFVGMPCIPHAIQRADVRERFNLEGNCMSDLALGWCCSCCSLIQQDKEVAYRQLNGDAASKQQYHSQTGMAYPGATEQK